MVDLIQDIASLTTIPKDWLDKLVTKSEWCIVSAFKELPKENSIHEFNLGIGILYIQYNNDELFYKFKPSSRLEKALIEFFLHGENPLELVLEKRLVDKITNTYKDIL